MKNSFFAIVFRQKNIKRWGLMRNMNEENLSSHAFEVAIVTHALAEIAKHRLGREYDIGKALEIALYHDATEVYTGDMPTPAKYHSPQMRAGYREIENSAAGELLSHIEEPLRSDYEKIIMPNDEELEALVKAADRLCAYIKCIEEEGCGNKEFISAKRATMEKLKECKLPEVKIFIDEYLDAFGCTLDEINS